MVHIRHPALAQSKKGGEILCLKKKKIATKETTTMKQTTMMTKAP
jgi:hypothetical protein